MEELGYTENHTSDIHGNPAGGTTFGVGFAIGWQDGPLGRDGYRTEPNGASVEDVIGACIGRLRYYQDSAFKCESNSLAISQLDLALEALSSRTADRELRKVEGTNDL